MKTAALIISMLLSANTHAWSLFGPKTYEECILQNMKGVTSDSAATQIQVACAVKFLDKKDNSCEKRELRPEELKLVKGTASFSNYSGEPYFRGNFYNGNQQIPLTDIIVSIQAKNIVPPETYSLHLSHPIGPLSSGTAGISIQTYPENGRGSWGIVSVKTCK